MRLIRYFSRYFLLLLVFLGTSALAQEKSSFGFLSELQRLGSSLDQTEQIGLQGVVVGDHFELDPIGAEQLARHLRGGDRFFRRAAAGGVRQHAAAELLDQSPETLTGAGPGRSSWRRS